MELNDIGVGGSPTCMSLIRQWLCSSCPLLFFWSSRVFEMEHFLALQMGLQPRQCLLLTKRLLTWCSRPRGFVAGRHQGAALCWEVCLDCVGKHSVHEHHGRSVGYWVLDLPNSWHLVCLRAPYWSGTPSGHSRIPGWL